MCSVGGKKKNELAARKRTKISRLIKVLTQLRECKKRKSVLCGGSWEARRGHLGRQSVHVLCGGFWGSQVSRPSRESSELGNLASPEGKKGEVGKTIGSCCVIIPKTELSMLCNQYINKTCILWIQCGKVSLKVKANQDRERKIMIGGFSGSFPFFGGFDITIKKSIFEWMVDRKRHTSRIW